MIPKLGDKVCDRWWRWKVGRVVKVMKTVVKVQFSDGVKTYDRAHWQFLERVCK